MACILPFPMKFITVSQVLGPLCSSNILPSLPLYLFWLQVVCPQISYLRVPTESFRCPQPPTPGTQGLLDLDPFTAVPRISLNKHPQSGCNRTRSIAVTSGPVFQVTFWRWCPEAGSTSGGTSITFHTPQRPGTVRSSSAFLKRLI